MLVVFPPFPGGAFFSFLVFGVRATLGLWVTFLAPTPVFLGFFFYGGGPRDESSMEMGSGMVSLVSPLMIT